MKKYWAIARQMIIRTLEFRAEIIIWIMLDAVPFLVMFLVWNKLFSQQEVIRGLTLGQTIHYYLLVALISGIIGCHFEEWRSREIKDGKIDFFMTRPLSYINEVLLKDLGGKMVYLVIFLPLYIFFFFFSQHIFDIPSLTLTLSQVSIVTLLLVSGYIFSFILSLWIVLGTFWLEGSEGIKHFKWITETVFSGSLLPVIFMPSWLQTVVYVLPFRYLYAIPIGVVQQTYSFGINDLIYVTTLLGGMVTVTSFMWARAVYQYSSVGG